MSIDCTQAGRDERKRLMQSLREKIYSGVQSLSDRNRSVSYYNGSDLIKLLNQLQAEEAFCETGRPPGQRRVFQIPYRKYD